MRILYVVPAVQHPTMRGALRNYHLMRELSRRHSLTLLALTQLEVTPEARREIADHTERCFIFPVAVSPPNAHRRGRIRRRVVHSVRLRRAVMRMRREFLRLVDRKSFDVVLFNGKLVQPVIDGFRDLPVVVDFCDATTMRERLRLRDAEPLMLGWRAWRYLRARRTERRLLDAGCPLAFISHRDREAVLGPGSSAEVVPNGIDLAFWTRRKAYGEQSCVVFTGVMDYAPNEDAALFLINSIIPRLRSRLPAVEVLIVGRDPTPALIEAGRRMEGVTVTGFVEDVRPYLERACVYVAPIRYASGLQNKILEALAMEVPVVTTPVVAEGLKVDSHTKLPLAIAAGAEEFIGAILSLIADREERMRMSVDGRRFVEGHFNWTGSAELLERMCFQAAGVDSDAPLPTSLGRAGRSRSAERLASRLTPTWP